MNDQFRRVLSKKFVEGARRLWAVDFWLFIEEKTLPLVDSQLKLALRFGFETQGALSRCLRLGELHVDTLQLALANSGKRGHEFHDLPALKPMDVRLMAGYWFTWQYLRVTGATFVRFDCPFECRDLGTLTFEYFMVLIELTQRLIKWETCGNRRPLVNDIVNAVSSVVGFDAVSLLDEELISDIRERYMDSWTAFQSSAWFKSMRTYFEKNPSGDPLGWRR